MVTLPMDEIPAVQREREREGGLKNVLNLCRMSREGVQVIINFLLSQGVWLGWWVFSGTTHLVTLHELSKQLETLH